MNRKEIYTTIFVLFTLSIFSFAQNPSEVIPQDFESYKSFLLNDFPKNQSDKHSALQRDPDNVLLGTRTDEWSNNSWIWIDSSEHFYNDANQIIETIGLHFNGSEWTFTNRSIREYDTNNNVTLSHSFNWGGTDWVSYSRRSYEYDVNNNETAYLSELWDNGPMSWSNNTREFNEYDADNNLTLFTAQMYEISTW